MIVVDASVSLKWFIPESDMAQALALLRSGRKLVAPEIIKHEVISGLVRRVRRDELSEGESRECIQDWLHALSHEAVHLIEDDDLLREASEIAFDIKHPLFDCIYLALAKRLDSPFVTADETLFQRATTVQSKVHSLKDVPSTLLRSLL